ncbi:MAG: long-chain fatty acid--CoA ligase [Deltaproteobacteria bacterium]|nr:long-chain fatty acid--CoA ligase [Deltaproteobacteria bacterium]
MTAYLETSMGAIFQNRVQEHGDQTLVIFKNKSGNWEEISWNKLNDMVIDLAMFLINKGIQPGDKVALFSPNRYEWWIADLAIITVGAVNVPIYATNSLEEARYIMENSDSKMCFCGEKEHTDKILKAKEQLPNFGDVVIFDDLDQLVPGVITLHDALSEGRAAANREEIDKRLIPINMDDVTTIIYTSGTTGAPKGVMLTHNNFVSNVNQVYSVDPDYIAGEHTFLSFLPLAHSLERTVGYYLAIFTGKKVAFAESTEKLLENFTDIRPTFLISVPRIYEKVHSGLLAKMATASPIAKTLFKWAMDVAKENLPYICQNRPRTGLFALKYNLADKLIFSKIKTTLGMDRLAGAISGGGPLSVADAEFFLGMGIKVFEGYGLTETTPVTNANTPKLIKPGTVGPSVKDTIVKIGEGGEILIKGPQVMKGYYKNEAATREAFTEDGFFRTGDIGEIDGDGYLKITGRIKDIMVTSGGKNISPQNIENSLLESLYIEQAAIIGDNRKYLSALIVPAFEALESWANEKSISFTSRSDLINNPEVINLYEQEVTNHMQDYARVEQIRKFYLMDKEWSQDKGEMTPTLKLKRKIIQEKYINEIESMYPSE